MESASPWISMTCLVAFFLASGAGAIDTFINRHVNFDWNIIPVFMHQPVIAINGMFPRPLINSTTNDMIHVNIFNNLDEPLLMTWNGIQQRLNSWQDGVLGTNCPIQPGRNWTYVFQVKGQIGSFFYFLSTNFQRAAGGFGPFRVNNRDVILVPFARPEAEFDLLIGDWYASSYKERHGLRISNVGTALSFNFRILSHRMVLVETEGSYTYDLSDSVGLP